MIKYSYTDNSHGLIPSISLSKITDGWGAWRTLVGDEVKKFLDEIKEATRQAHAHRGYTANVDEYITRVIARYV